MVDENKHLSIKTEIQRGIRAQGSELAAADVGRLLSVLEGFGPVQAGDVGKRVWTRPYGLVMENDEQRDARKAREREG